MSSKTYQCYKFTRDDKEWRKAGGKISRKFIRGEKDMCTRHDGNSFTRGNNSQYTGCGNCWCCQPISGKSDEISPPKAPSPKNPSLKKESRQSEDSYDEIDVDEWEHCNIDYLVNTETLEIYSEEGEAIGIWGEGEYQGFIIPDEALHEIPPEVLKRYYSHNIRDTKLSKEEEKDDRTNFDNLLELSLENLCLDLASQQKYSSDEIIKRRKFVYNGIKEFLGITETELTNTISGLDRLFELFNRDNRAFFNELLKLYDEAFFQNTLSEFCCENNCKFNICWNNRCTTTGGICKYDHRLYTKINKQTGKLVKIKTQLANIEIHLAPKVFTEGLLNLPNGNHLKTGGLTCDNFLNCMLLIFEHELVHALIACFCVGDGNIKHSIEATWKGIIGGGGHGIIFMSIVHNLFGQTEFRHELLKNRHTIPTEIMKDYIHRGESELKRTLRIGEEVYFPKKGTMVRGIIIESGGRRTKKASIKSNDGKTWNVSYQIIYHRK